MNPSYLGLLRCVRIAQFSSCLIKNTSVDKLTSLHLVYIMQKLRQNGKVEIILDQPLTIMQDFDVKQIEANAKLAGFSEVTLSNTSYFNPAHKKIKTQLLTILQTHQRP